MRAAPLAGKHPSVVFPTFPQFSNHNERLARERNQVGAPHLHPICWYAPQLFTEIELRPLSRNQLAGSDEDQRHQMQSKPHKVRAIVKLSFSEQGREFGSVD